MEHTNDTFLSDWLADKISDEQLKLLVSNEDFLAYQKLKNALGNYSVATPNMEEQFGKIQQKINKKQNVRKPKVLHLWKYTAVAASLLLFFVLYQVYYFSNEVTTGFGLTQTITLKDQSKVTLNAKSKLSFPNQFNWNRTLKLDGEAFFEVEKGSKFTVETPQGTISVLGTKFNVISENNFFEVNCYEGKVSVVVGAETTILTKNKSLRFYDKQLDFKDDNLNEKPNWINKESSFKDVPVEVVINKFINQFNKKVNYPTAIKSIKFNGSFSNTNIETALKSITIPLHLKYTINKDQIILAE